MTKKQGCRNGFATAPYNIEDESMNQILRKEAEEIVRYAIKAVCPDAAVRRALQGRCFSGRLYLVAVGKAAWKMAQTAMLSLKQPYHALKSVDGLIVTGPTGTNVNDVAVALICRK